MLPLTCLEETKILRNDDYFRSFVGMQCLDLEKIADINVANGMPAAVEYVNTYRTSSNIIEPSVMKAQI